MNQKISELKNKLKEQGIKGLALDIDETLSDTNPHWFEHMINFHRPEGMSNEEIIEKYRFVEEVPGWRTEEADKYIQEALHSNDFNESIPLIEGADKAVQELNKLVPIVAYVTARPTTVIEGTLRWLKKHNFPDAELITRPQDDKGLEDFNTNKNRWKAGVLNTLYPEVLGIVDDNPVLAHELEALDYKGRLYIYGKEGGEFINHEHILVCPTWKDVLEAVTSNPVERGDIN